MKSQEVITIYTDGSCLGNPGPWGRAALLMYKWKDKKISGWNPDTTNNQMELTAIIKALELLKTDKVKLEVYTDSSYVKNGITKWIANWKSKWRKTAGKKEVKNKELWVALDTLSSKFNIDWHWVKAHASNEYNNFVDKLARKEATKLLP